MAQDERKRIGRPPRIDRDAIARAVLAIGFDDVTMKSAAEHLGISVPGLYHYVHGRDDLIRLAADYSLARTELPTHHGQEWEAWLREWAHYIRGSMVSRPELITHFLTGGIDEARFNEVVATIIEVLVGHGFTDDRARDLWEVTSALALGSAAAEIRQRGRDTADPKVADQAFERRLDLLMEGLRPR